MSTHTFKELPVDSIFPSKDNARKFDPKSQDFQDLVISVRAGGVRIPIHVWPHPTKKAVFEIRAGERRWRACKSVGCKTIPAIIHNGITKQVAMMLTYTENKFQEPLKPLEEITEIATCMKEFKYDAKLIGDLLGQTEQWVRLRANIHKNLFQGFRQLFANVYHNWTIGHLTRIARLPANIQKLLLNEIKSKHWQWRNISVSDLDRRLSDALQLLNKAVWNLDDEALYPKAGSCSKCSMRSGSEPLLWFEAGAANEQNLKKDRCLDLMCWKQKTKLYLQQRAKQLSEIHDGLAYISKDYLSQDDKKELTDTFGRVLGMDDVQKSTKGSKGAMPALIVQGTGTGDIIYVKQREFARAGVTGTGTKFKGQVTPLKERRANLKNKRWAQVLLDLREKVEAAGIENVVYKDKITSVMALVAVYGNDSTCQHGQKEVKRLIEQKRKIAPDANSEALVELWSSFKPTLDKLLTYNGPVTQTNNYLIDNAKWIAQLVRVDIDEIFKDVSQRKGFTVPKSWKGLNSDGTPKKKKTTPAGSKRKSSKAQKDEETKKKINKSKIIAAKKIGLKVDMSDKAESRSA